MSQLQAVLSKLPRDEAALHLDRCIKSGLWVPNAKDAAGNGDEETNDDEEDSNQEKLSEDVEKKPVD